MRVLTPVIRSGCKYLYSWTIFPAQSPAFNPSMLAMNQSEAFCLFLCWDGSGHIHADDDLDCWSSWLHLLSTGIIARPPQSPYPEAGTESRVLVHASEHSIDELHLKSEVWTGTYLRMCALILFSNEWWDWCGVTTFVCIWTIVSMCESYMRSLYLFNLS